MTLEDLISYFITEFPGVPREDIKSGTIFRNIPGWSSMMALIITSGIDERYGVILTPDDLRSSQTISDLYERIRYKMMA